VSETLNRVRTLVLAGDYLVSDHAADEMDEDGIVAGHIAAGIAAAVAIEDYRDRPGDRRVLALHRDAAGRPLHVVWAVPAARRPALMVTVYRPDPKLWSFDFMRRL
jgi:hypothetical protein